MVRAFNKSYIVDSDWQAYIKSNSSTNVMVHDFVLVLMPYQTMLIIFRNSELMIVSSLVVGTGSLILWAVDRIGHRIFDYFALIAKRSWVGRARRNRMPKGALRLYPAYLEDWGRLTDTWSQGRETEWDRVCSCVCEGEGVIADDCI